MADTENTMNIEVAYALPNEQSLLQLTVSQGMTAQQAIEQSGILQQYSDIDLEKNKIGIFSKACPLDTVLRNHDRVEIYRALIADPKAVRKQRAAEGKRMKKGET